MKVKYFIGAAAAMAAAAVCLIATSSRPSAGVDDKDYLKIVEDIPTVQAFLKDPVPEADLQRIVNAGVNAPSAMNMQPWHFTVVTDGNVIGSLVDAQKKTMSNMKRPPMPPKGMPAAGPDGKPSGMPKPPTGKGPRSGLGDSPAVIFISCTEGGDFDAGLACECMNDMANLLGYGTKIVSSVKMLFAGPDKADLYKTLQVPDGQDIVAAILVGKTDTEAYDAVSGATPRKSSDVVVSFLK